MFMILGGDGKEYGPVSPGQIKEWMHGNRANLQTKCRRVGETTWKTLADYAEFNFAGAKAFVPPADTPADTPSVSPLEHAASVAEFSATIADAEPAEPARRGTRLVAQLIDSLTGLLFLLPAGIMIALEGGDFKNVSAGASLVLFACALALMIMQGYLLTEYGQTVGKKLMDIRIVRFEDGGKAGFVKAFAVRLLLPGLFGAIPLVGPAFTLVDILFIFRPDRRCVHDLIAGTIVVKA